MATGVLGGLERYGQDLINPIQAGQDIYNAGKGLYNHFNPGAQPTSSTPTIPSSGASTTGQSALPTTPYSDLQNQYNNALYQMTQLRPGNIVGNFNTGAQYAQARQQAQGQENTYYTNLMNQFNNQIAQQQGEAQQANQMAQEGIQANLQNTLGQNQISGQRVGEDTSTALSNLANYQQNYKQTEGLNFDQAQRALSGNLAAGGTGTSGLGQQQVQQAQTQEQLGQQAEGQQYNVQRVAQQLFANRSMEDLSRSSQIAGQQAGLQTKAANFDLTTHLSALQRSQQTQQETYNKLEKDSIAADASSAYAKQVNDYLQGLRGKVAPQDFSATAQYLLGSIK